MLMNEEIRYERILNNKTGQDQKKKKTEGAEGTERRTGRLKEKTAYTRIKTWGRIHIRVTKYQDRETDVRVSEEKGMGFVRTWTDTFYDQRMQLQGVTGREKGRKS